MEPLRASGAGSMSAVVKKRRSSTSRRPWLDPQSSLYDRSPRLPSSAPSFVNQSYLSPCGSDAKHYKEGMPKDNLDRVSTRQEDSVGKSYTGTAPQESTERKLTVKLKLGGVTRTVNEKPHPSQNQQKLVSLVCLFSF